MRKKELKKIKQWYGRVGFAGGGSTEQALDGPLGGAVLVSSFNEN